MSRCEQELCVHWNGGGGCPCDVFDLKPVGPDGQELQSEPDAWDECEQCEHDRDEHGPDGCEAAVLTVAGVTTCSCGAFAEAA